MTIILIIIALTLLLAVTVDVLVTTLTIGGGGPITSRLSTYAWNIALKLHKRQSSHRRLATVGLVLTTAIALLWFATVWVAWVIFFCSSQGAIINSTTKVPATVFERIYFVGYSLSTLGLGDFQPKGWFWQLASVVASCNGFFLVTLTFAYLLPLISALAAKRSLSVYLASLGGTADEILIRAWNGKDFGQLSQHLINLTPMLTQQGENHLIYPILHYYHSVERSRALALSLASLDEAMTILAYGVDDRAKIDPGVIGGVRRATSAYLKTLKSAYLEAENYEPPLPNLDLLRKHQIPTVSDRHFIAATKCLTQRRRLLLALVKNDGWTWDAIASSATTNRANNLDDSTIVEDVTLH